MFRHRPDQHNLIDVAFYGCGVCGDPDPAVPGDAVVCGVEVVVDGVDES